MKISVNVSVTFDEVVADLKKQLRHEGDATKSFEEYRKDCFCVYVNPKTTEGYISGFRDETVLIFKRANNGLVYLEHVEFIGDGECGPTYKANFNDISFNYEEIKKAVLS